MSKPKGKAPAFQLYAGDFLTDVMDWSDEQVGAHIRLLCWSWVNRRGIPRDTQRLTRIAPGAVEAWPVIGSKWIDGPDDTWVNERLESTRSESDAFRASQRERSLLAVAARQGQRGPNREPMEEPKGKPMGSPMGDPLEGEEEVFTQNRKEHAKVEPTAIVFPLLFTPEMKHAAQCWLRHRSEIRHPLKASSREAFFRKCIEWGDIRAIAAIEYSIAQGYQGLIEPKNFPTYGQPATEDEYTAKRRAVAEANAKHYGVANAGTGH